jgi:pyruvate dehydrogenase complex dehydrogenase (E1) component
MLRLYPSEEFRKIPIDAPLKLNYAISNYGRLMSYAETFDDGRILKGGRADGYPTFIYKAMENGVLKRKHFFLFRLVAEFFIPKTSDDQCYVLHLDYVRDNDKVSNLAWATREEMLAHSRKSPHVIEAKTVKRLGVGGKLTSTQVIHLKKRLNDPNRKTRVKMLAKQFGISEMQISRIRSGENWGHIKV